jgi:hypothetical protein
LQGGDGEKSDPLKGTSSLRATDLNYNGKGGTSNLGGKGGTCTALGSGSDGSQYTGGAGYIFSPGGGGGWYGGGGGGSTKATTGASQWIFAGGGGGSSNINTTYGTQVYMLQANGNVVAGASYLPSGYSSATIGSGGVPINTAGTDNGTDGKPGLVVITYTTYS